MTGGDPTDLTSTCRTRVTRSPSPHGPRAVMVMGMSPGWRATRVRGAATALPGGSSSIWGTPSSAAHTPSTADSVTVTCITVTVTRCHQAMGGHGAVGAVGQPELQPQIGFSGGHRKLLLCLLQLFCFLFSKLFPFGKEKNIYFLKVGSWREACSEHTQEWLILRGFFITNKFKIHLKI